MLYKPVALAMLGWPELVALLVVFFLPVGLIVLVVVLIVKSRSKSKELLPDEESSPSVGSSDSTPSLRPPIRVRRDQVESQDSSSNSPEFRADGTDVSVKRDIETRLGKLHELLNRKLITAEEFEAKKQEMLKEL